IGGVINIISQDVPTGDDGISGDVMYRYGSAGTVNAPSGNVSAKIGRFAVRVGASYRDSEPYRAPAGTFGKITLAENELVHDSGIRDRSYDLFSSFDLSTSGRIYARAGWYSADDAGFGFIDPARLGPGQPRIQILYPDQSFARYSIGYKSSAVPSFLAHRIDISGYTQRNERHLDNLILIPAGPGATIDTRTWNFTDLSTVGARLELARPLGQAATLTYGADAFRDRSDNTDSSRTVITGFGPPITRTSNTPQVPNATFSSAGIFGQLEARPLDRLSTIFGARYQTVSAKTRATNGLDRAAQDDQDHTLVWSANGLFRVTGNANVVMSFGRGFRAANLVERFFEGLAPEGNGFQRANPQLKAETSFNSDLGTRYRAGPVSVEGFVFRNDLSNAIRARATGDSVNGRPAFQNRNIDRLRMQGIELSAGVRTTTGIDATASFTRLNATNISDKDSPVGDSYSSKVISDIGYRAPSGRFTAGYTVRYQGEQNEVIVGTNPIGPVIPAFVVHSARASVVVLRAGDVVNELALRIENLGNRLYAEFPNASFFRPEPGRNVNLALQIHF
ncbi:MAG TPA: TonB-dependent receptor, partial [Rhodothermia bacterium]|nr:TonB-dependent receptor [Rhodothermia bacterium]